MTTFPAMKQHFCECEHPYLGAQPIGRVQCERCGKCVDKAARAELQKMEEREAEAVAKAYERCAAFHELYGGVTAVAGKSIFRDWAAQALAAIRACTERPR